MEIKHIARYVHGSGDSLDVDTFYVIEGELPDKATCKAFCDGIAGENANLIAINGGIVTACYKGTPDEVNNSLLATYPLHSQEFPLLVERMVERDIPLKCIRAVRGILSHLSRSQFRPLIKRVLKSTWKDRLDVFYDIGLRKIDFGGLNSHMTAEDIKKVIAFQIGQTLGLLDGHEFYSKKEIANAFPSLRPFLYRESGSEISVLQGCLDEFISRLRKMEAEDMDGLTVRFPLNDGIYDIVHEKRLR